MQAVLNPKNKVLVKIDKDSGRTSCIRPADVFLLPKMCIDVTVSASTSDTYKDLPVGRFFNLWAMEKKTKNADTCALYDLEFIPFVLDYCGTIHIEAWGMLNRFASGYSDQTKKSYSQCVAICRRRISFALHIGMSHQLVPLLLLRRTVGGSLAL